MTFKVGFLYVVLTVLELVLQTRITLNSEISVSASCVLGDITPC